MFAYFPYDKPHRQWCEIFVLTFKVVNFRPALISECGNIEQLLSK